MTGPPPGSGSAASSASAASSVSTEATTTLIAAWQEALGAHHAAIYGYGELGPYLTEPVQITQARTTEQAHRATRDSLETQLVQAGATPAVAQPRYAPTERVDSSGAAQRWALELEEGCAACYRYVLAVSAQPGLSMRQSAPARVSATAGLSTATITAISWRILLTPTRPTVAFPGE